MPSEKVLPSEIDYRNRFGIDSSAARAPLKVRDHVAPSWFTMSRKDARRDFLIEAGVAGAIVVPLTIAVLANIK